MAKPHDDNPGSTEQSPPKTDPDVAEEAKNPALKSQKPVAQPQKKGIPELNQRTLSSEQRAQLMRGNNLGSRMRRMRSNVARSFFAIAVIALVLGLIYIFLVQGKKTNVAAIEDGGEIATSFENVISSGDARELMKFSMELNQNLMTQPLPNLLNRLKQKKQIGQKLEELHEDESSYFFGLREQLECLIMLDTLNLSNSLNDKNIRNELFETATRLLEHEDIRIARNARLGLSMSAMHDYILDPTDENYQKVEARVADNEENLIKDLPAVLNLQRFVAFIDVSERQDHVKQFKLLAGNILKKSSTVEIWNIGAGIHDELLLGKIDYQEMNRLILSGNKTAIKELGEIVDSIAGSDRVSAIPIAKVISLVESLGQIGMVELEREYIDALKQSSAEIKFTQNRELVENTLRDYEKRKKLLDNVFDLSGSSYDGSPIEMERLKGKIIVVLFYSGFNSDSAACLDRIMDLQYLSSEGVEWIICSAEDKPSEKVQKSLTAANSDFIVVSKLSAPNYLEQCPISKVPFLLLIDRDQKVVGVNVDLDQLRLRIEKLLAG